MRLPDVEGVLAQAASKATAAVQAQ